MFIRLRLAHASVVQIWKTVVISGIIMHSTHYLFSDWPKACGKFSKSGPGTLSSCRLYNNHVKDTQGHG